MTAKKITVLGDPADEPLTPEEEQALEVKVDKMLDPSPHDEPVGKTVPNEAAVETAPQLAGKGKESIGDTPASETQPEADDSGLASEELPVEPLDVDFGAGDEPDGGEADTPADQSEASASESQAKKYRPPDGPLPFKRAQPDLEPKPGTAGVIDDQTAHHVSRQLAQETDEPGTGPAVVQKLSRPRPGRGLAKSLRRALLLPVLLVVIIMAVPQTRAMALNLAHVKRSLHVTVVDSATHAPLANVNVQIGQTSATTDQNGKATLNKLSLGSHAVILQKPGFASASRSAFLDWRGSTLQDIPLTVTGQQYIFNVTDYVSGKLVSASQASVGVYTARGDAKGRIILIVDKSQVGTRPITVTAAGYRTQEIKLPTATTTPTTVRLVPAASDYFVSKQAGRYNVYATDIDGQHTSLLLSGTGNETNQLSLVPDTAGTQLAYVSTRDNQRDKAGILLDALTVVNVRTKAAETLAHAQRIKVVGWFGGRLVYTALKADVSTTDANRYQLLAYDTATKKTAVLDHAPGFNDVAVAGGTIYYATVDHSTGGKSQLLSIRPDGTGKQTVLASEVASIIRSSYKTLQFATATSWYSYDFSGKPTAINAGADTEGRLYVDSPDGQHSVRIDETKHQLVLYTKSSGTEKVLRTQTGLTRPVRWLDNGTLAYRVVATGSSDYALSLAGGTPQKITDVLDINGLTLWHD